MKHKYFTRNEDYELEEVDPHIVDDILRQYFERRYISSIVIGSFIIGFLLGIIAYAIG